MNIFLSPYRHRSLLFELTKREVLGRYRGSLLGITWSFFHPLLMLAIYTFVFSVVFRARWNIESDSRGEFALALFCGLIVFNLFAECLNKAPTLILGNVTYVKKVVFPLDILPYVTLGSALFHFGVSLLVWLTFHMMLYGAPPVSIGLLPITLVPLLLFVLGSMWLLSSLGVYLRDISQVVGVVTTAMLFLSPIFYPMSALPESFQVILSLNPLTQPVEHARAVMFWGTLPSLSNWLIAFLFSVCWCWFGFQFFQRTRRGFADVI